jgi:ParB-like chromosome segregation protein Spo0J
LPRVKAPGREHSGVTRLSTRDIPIADLTFLPRNPRRGDEGRIRESVRRLGQYRSVVVRDISGELVILAGNHTVRAMRAEGHETANCGVIRCTDDEARRIAAADNRLGELPDPETGERYDKEDLTELLTWLDGDYDGTGWTGDDLAALLGEGESDKLGDKEGDAPTDDLPASYGVIVECDTEQQQARLLAQLDGEGFRVRALMA